MAAGNLNLRQVLQRAGEPGCPQKARSRGPFFFPSTSIAEDLNDSPRTGNCEPRTQNRDRENPSVRIGVDTGGTFTDFVCIDESGLTVYKARTTPDDPTTAIVAGLRHLAGNSSE